MQERKSAGEKECKREGVQERRSVREKECRREGEQERVRESRLWAC